MQGKMRVCAYSYLWHAALTEKLLRNAQGA